MEVSKNIIAIWKRFLVGGEYEGDFLRLCERASLNKKTVRKAIQTGKCSPSVFKKINDAAVELINEIKASETNLLNVTA